MSIELNLKQAAGCGAETLFYPILPGEKYYNALFFATYIKYWVFYE